MEPTYRYRAKLGRVVDGDTLDVEARKMAEVACHGVPERLDESSKSHQKSFMYLLPFNY